MRKLLSIDTDNEFFRLFQAALKSFLKHNPGWDVEIIDAGMTAAQRREVATVGRVISIERGDESTRWPSTFPRLQHFRDNPDRADLILHLDADTLTFGSIEPVVNQLTSSGADFAFAELVRPIGEYIRFHHIARRFFDRFDQWKDFPNGNMGVAMAPATIMATIAGKILEIAEKYSGLFFNHEQEIAISVLYDGGYKLLRMPRIYNYSLANLRVLSAVLVEPPITNDRQRVVIAHIPIHKWAFFTGTRTRESVGRWWLNIVERYEEESWPIHASP